MSRRDEFDDYRGDVIYEVWRSGGNVDRINDERVSDSFYDGRDYESAADRELRHQREDCDFPPDRDIETH